MCHDTSVAFTRTVYLVSVVYRTHRCQCHSCIPISFFKNLPGIIALLLNPVKWTALSSPVTCVNLSNSNGMAGKIILIQHLPFVCLFFRPSPCSVISSYVDDEIQYVVALGTYTIDCPMLAWPERQLLVRITVLLIDQGRTLLITSLSRKHGSNAKQGAKSTLQQINMCNFCKMFKNSNVQWSLLYIVCPDILTRMREFTLVKVVDMSSGGLCIVQVASACNDMSYS